MAIQLNGTLYKRRLRSQYLPCAVCGTEIDYDAAAGMDESFYTELGADDRLIPVHYSCASGAVRG